MDRKRKNGIAAVVDDSRLALAGVAVGNHSCVMCRRGSVQFRNKNIQQRKENTKAWRRHETKGKMQSYESCVHTW